MAAYCECEMKSILCVGKLQAIYFSVKVDGRHSNHYAVKCLKVFNIHGREIQFWEVPRGVLL